MDKKAILHVGLHKTGTSSIQDTLIKYNDSLIKENFYYPQSLTANGSAFFYHMFAEKFQPNLLKIKRSFFDTKKIRYFIKRIKLKRELIEIEKKYKVNKFIFSAESINLFNIKALECIKDFYIKELGIKDIIIIGLRDKLSYINSAFQEVIKTGNNPTSIEHLLFTYKEKIEKFEKVFGKSNVIAYKFEDSFFEGRNLVEYFLKQFDCKIKIKDIVKSNISLSDKSVDIIYYINSKKPFLDKNNKVTEGRIKNDLESLFKIQGNKFTLDNYEVFNGIDDKKDVFWLRNNYKIEYDVLDIYPKNKKKIIFDECFYKEFKKIFSNLTQEIQKLVYQYFLDLNEQVDPLFINWLQSKIRENNYVNK